MSRDTLSFTEISCAIHERHPYSSERRETKFAIPKIIEALLTMAEREELPVSFANGSAAGVVHTSLAGAPYTSEKRAARAAKSRNDLQSIHCANVRIDGGWGIEDVPAEFDDWFGYFADKDDRKDDQGKISGKGLYALGETLLVTRDDWNSFEKGRVFQDWIKDNAPPTKEQVKEFWPKRSKTKPSSLPGESRASGRSNQEHSTRKRDPGDELALGKRIQTVIAKARSKWPDSSGRPSLGTMAQVLERIHANELAYKRETIRKILAGKYPQARRLSIKGLI